MASGPVMTTIPCSCQAQRVFGIGKHTDDPSVNAEDANKYSLNKNLSRFRIFDRDQHILWTHIMSSLSGNRVLPQIHVQNLIRSAPLI